METQVVGKADCCSANDARDICTMAESLVPREIDGERNDAADLSCVTDMCKHRHKCDPNLSLTKTITIIVDDVNEKPRVNEERTVFAVEENREHGQQGFTSGSVEGTLVGRYIPPTTGVVSSSNSGDCDRSGIVGSDSIFNASNALSNASNTTSNPLGGCSAARVKARDDDAGQVCDIENGEQCDASKHLVFSIVGGDGQDLFNIDELTGQVSVSQQGASYEEVETYDTLNCSKCNDLFEKTRTDPLTTIASRPTAYVAYGTGARDVADRKIEDMKWIKANTQMSDLTQPCCQKTTVKRYALDYERQDRYTIKVRATDSGRLSSGRSGEKLHHERNITIMLVDVNEHPVLHAFEFAIREAPRGASRQGALVGQIYATDVDSINGVDMSSWNLRGSLSGQLTYTFESVIPVTNKETTYGNYADAFEIDSKTGVIRVKEDVLDYEDISRYVIVTRATDDGGHEGSPLFVTNTVTVVVEDADDSAVISFLGGDSMDGTTVKMLTKGGDKVQIRGINFGSKHIETSVAAYEVSARYENVNEKYEATNCKITVPYYEITCDTSPGVGAGMVWSVSVNETTGEDGEYNSQQGCICGKLFGMLHHQYLHFQKLSTSYYPPIDYTVIVRLALLPVNVLSNTMMI